jgi:hypothetical protein
MVKLGKNVVLVNVGVGVELTETVGLFVGVNVGVSVGVVVTDCVGVFVSV